MKKKDICRWCKHYRPDERYNGVLGWCDKHDSPAIYDHECTEREEGTQYWLCGKEVTE